MRSSGHRVCRALALAVLACSPAPDDVRADTFWLRAALPQHDAVHASDTEDSLRRRFGAEHVTQTWLYAAEGDSSFGTTIYADDPMRRIEVRWQEPAGRSRPRFAEVSGSASRWRLFPGITLGMPLTDVERVNGRPFLLAGFEWDYPGRVRQWNGGRLDSLWQRSATASASVDVIFASVGSADPALTGQVLGDREFSSDFPPMRALNPRVVGFGFVPR